MSNTLDLIHELGFKDDEIAECQKRNGLLSMELEFTRSCNLRCIYCYSSAGTASANELELDEIKDIVLQAKELGAKKIILLGGGEPLVYGRVRDVIEYISSLGLQQFLFTNGVLITQETARFLFSNKVCVIVKSNSMKPEVQDLLAGVKGAFARIRRGIGFLMEAGYPDGEAVLGIQTVICRQNIGELPDMWMWARERNIVPYFEMLTHQGRAKENPDLAVSPSEVGDLFSRLELIDSERFAIQWKSRPTIAAFSCKRHLYSCLINSRGQVQPCTGIDMAVGNIREKTLGNILATSKVINNLRHIYDKIEGSCRACEHNCECYGCRGNAYQLTGNYLAADPTCWRYKKIMNEDPAHLCK